MDLDTVYPGKFKTLNKLTVLSANYSVRKNHLELDEFIPFNTEVEITEFHINEDEQRMRGKLNTGKWITVLNLETNEVLVQPVTKIIFQIVSHICIISVQPKVLKYFSKKNLNLTNSTYKYPLNYTKSNDSGIRPNFFLSSQNKFEI